jgi:hypothetical protein
MIIVKLVVKLGRYEEQSCVNPIKVSRNLISIEIIILKNQFFS